MAGAGAGQPIEQEKSAAELEAGAGFQTGKTYKVTVLPTGFLNVVLLDWTGARPIRNTAVEAKGPPGAHEKTYALSTDEAGAIRQPDVLLGEYVLKVGDSHETRVPAVLTADEMHFQAVYGVGGPGVLDDDPPDPDPPPEPEPDDQFFQCCTIEGPHFEFDRSFVRPSVADSLKPVAAALDGDPKRRALLFGHTDKAGSEDYNKGLSDRRAGAVFALLTHDVDAWEALHGQEKWGIRATQLMLAHVGYEPGALGSNDAKTQQAVKAFQTDHALDPDGDPGPKTRAKLFQAYFAKVHATPYGPERFADFQYVGCSELNPLVETELPEEQNRRVIAFVFTEKSKPKALPCRRGDLGPCHQSLKQPAGSGRVASFRCQVFDDISEKCSCEKPAPPTVEPFDLQVHVEDPDAVLVVLDGGAEANRILASVANDLGDGVRGFDLQHLEDKKTYRLELRDGDEVLLAAWTLAPGDYHRAAEKGDADALAAAFAPLPVA